MTIKVIAMLARKPGLSETEFVDYYENRHAPLILSIAPQIRDYRRNYLRREGAILATGARPPDFDVRSMVRLSWAATSPYAASPILVPPSGPTSHGTSVRVRARPNSQIRK